MNKVRSAVKIVLIHAEIKSSSFVGFIYSLFIGTCWLYLSIICVISHYW